MGAIPMIWWWLIQQIGPAAFQSPFLILLEILQHMWAHTDTRWCQWGITTIRAHRDYILSYACS